MANSITKIDGKTQKVCATCVFWGGYRKPDGIGGVEIDQNNLQGVCGQEMTKGFSGATMGGMQICQDYRPLVR